MRGPQTWGPCPQKEADRLNIIRLCPPRGVAVPPESQNRVLSPPTGPSVASQAPEMPASRPDHKFPLNSKGRKSKWGGVGCGWLRPGAWFYQEGVSFGVLDLGLGRRAGVGPN